MPAHGDLVDIRLGPQRAWMVCHPELVQEMLRDSRTFDKGGPQYDRLRLLMGDGVVTCPHGEHRRQRRLLQPDFRASRVADHTELMGQEAASVHRGWRAGEQIDVSAEMMTLTTRVMGRVLFSDSLDAATATEIRRCLGVVVRGLFVRTVVPVDAVFRLPTPANRRYGRALARLHTLVDALVAERRRGPDRDDLLGTLLRAARGGADEAVTEREMHDQLLTLLLTGVETTALCLASAFSLLARNPEAERRLHTEVDSVLAGRALPDVDDLPHLVRTRCVITETLRHSPPGWLFTRITTRATELAGCRLPRGATVLYSPYLLHHDPASFPDPDAFLPDRWLPGGDGARRDGALIPFAAGSRKCLGDAFAVTEATVALASIAARWRLRHRPGPVESPRPAVTLGPRSLTMICEPRTPRATTGSLLPDSRTAGDNGVNDA
ncbi:cytochrome P450 [Streptomyces bullii]